METLASAESASPETEPELHLLLEHDRKSDWHRWKSAAVVSAIFHAFLLLVLLFMPESAVEERVYNTPQITRLTPIFIPKDLITQTAPNKGKISKELTIQAIPERPVVKAPTPAPAAKKAASAPLPPAQTPKNEQKPTLLAEAPKLELPKGPENQSDQLSKLNVPPPPPPPTEQPKLALQNVPPPAQSSSQGKNLRQLIVPNPSVDNTIRELSSNGGAPGGRQSVGDAGDTGAGSGLNLPPSAGRPQSNLELQSDPMGVDFRPYMFQVLAAVRRNWFAVYPEAARLGQRGEVALQFAIVKVGSVTKVVLSTQSGSKPLDEAAIAAISASNPLPPLPTQFKGDRIVLRMTFMYNMPRR